MRINSRIRVSPVRLIGHDGEQIGIIPTSEAIERAEAIGLDLVEVSPNSRPPVCRILDYGKYKYELSKKDRLAKKKSHAFQMKEMRYRPKIDEHDYQFKAKHVRNFIEMGSKVKTFVRFRGREMAYTEQGKKILDRVAEDLKDVAVVESPARLDGRQMTMVLAPTVEVLKKARAHVKTGSSEKKNETPVGKPKEAAIAGKSTDDSIED